MIYHHKNGTAFRKADRSDLYFLKEMKGESWWGTHGVAMINDEDQERWLDNLPSDCLVLIGFNDTTPIGFCIISDIEWVSRTASISGAVHHEMRSIEQSRVAFEAGLDFAFEMLNLYRLNAEVASFHYPARRIEIEHLGFVIEGRKRECIYKCGRYYDSIVLGMLRREWENHPRVVSYGGSCCTEFDHVKAQKLMERADRKAN